MITADDLYYLTSLTENELSSILNRSGYLDTNFDTVAFKGVTPNGDFCYIVTYTDDLTHDGILFGHVFVKYDHDRDIVTAEF